MSTSHGKKGAAAEEDAYPYQLVKFYTKNKKGEADIDCVPSTWITFNVTTGKCECKYLPPPYNDDDFDLLHGFVRQQASPPQSWPSYPVTLCGHAKTYNESTKRLELLRREEYAYTSDEKKSKADKAVAATKSYRAKKIKSDGELIQKLSHVPKIPTESGDDSSTNASDKSDVPSSESSTDESQDENENDKMRQNSNHKLDNFDFLQDQDYMTEGPKKSLKSSGKKPVSQNPSLKLSAHCETKGSDSSIASDKPSKVSNLPSTSSISDKNTAASVPPPRSKKGTDSSVSLASSSSVSTNSNVTRTQSPATSPTGTKKGTKGSLVATVDALRVDIQTMTKEFQELKGIVQKSALAQDVFGANVKSFASEYDVCLPIQSMDAFKAFDERLLNEKKFRKEFVATLHYLVDPRTNLSKNVTGILKKHLTRDVAVNFTAVKASGGKSIFKDTCFCKCMLEVVRMKCKTIEKDNVIPITEKLYYHELGSALSNAVDWDGQRKQRVSRRKPIEKGLAEPEKEKEQEPE